MERMSLMRRLLVVAFSLFLLSACSPAQASADPMRVASSCPVTPWSQATPSNPQAASYTTTWYSNGNLWAGLARANRGAWLAGPQGVEVLWLGVARHTLSITGLELDRPSGHLQSYVSPDSPAFGGLVTSLVFPYSGCWTVIGGTPDQMLVFTVQVQPPRMARTAGEADP